MRTRSGIRALEAHPGSALAARLLLLALAASSAGCGGGRDATDKQLSALRAELVKLRADDAVLTERLDALELARDGYRSRPPQADEAGGDRVEKPQGADAGSDRPELEVVRLAPEDDGARPVLRSTTGGVVIEGEASPASSASTDGDRRASGNAKTSASAAPPSKQPPKPSRRTP